MSRIPRIGTGGKPLFGSLPRLCLPANPCCEETSICDEENIIADFYWNQTTAPPACKIALINLSTNVGGSPIVSYLWETATAFGVFIFASTSEDYLIPDATNIVWVRLTVTTDNGCKGTVTKAVNCGDYECCIHGNFPTQIQLIYPDIKWVDPADSSEHFGIPAGSVILNGGGNNIAGSYATALPYPTMNWFGTTIQYYWTVQIRCLNLGSDGTLFVDLNWGPNNGIMFGWTRRLGATFYGANCNYFSLTGIRYFPAVSSIGSVQVISPP